MSSCVFEPALSSEVLSEDEAVMMGVDIMIPTKTATSTGYEAGNYFENHIDTENADYRIFFFTEDNVFINRFIPMIISSNSDENNNYTKYRFQGKVPEGVESGSNFKVVAIANWGSYKDEAMIPGQTTLAQLCEASWSQFSFASHEFSFFLKMPFFGVRQYNNYVFEVPDSELPKVLEPVDMLRGMAKVEVIFDYDKSTNRNNLEIASLSVDRYNEIGYCAPSGIDHQKDYVTEDNMYTADNNPVHLVGGQNTTTYNSLNFHHLSTEDTEQRHIEKWMLYLLEYDNRTDVSDYTTIYLKFKGQNDLFPIHFANYSEGKTDNYIDRRLDIKRNTLYRFRVNDDMLVSLDFSIYVDDYEDINGGSFDMDTQL